MRRPNTSITARRGGSCRGTCGAKPRRARARGARPRVRGGPSPSRAAHPTWEVRTGRPVRPPRRLVGPTRRHRVRRRRPRARTPATASTASTASGHTFSPPVMITSSTRPNTCSTRLVEGADVTGVEPAFSILGIGAVAVAAQEHRSSDRDLAGRRVDCHLDAVERHAVVHDATAGLGHAVRRHHVGGELRGRRRAPEHDEPEAGGIDPPAARSRPARRGWRRPSPLAVPRPRRIRPAPARACR